MKKVYVVSVQPDPDGPVFGRVIDPNDFQKSQDFAHHHTEVITKDLLVAGADSEQVAGFLATETGGLNVSIAAGDVVDENGVQYEMADASVVTMADAHETLPRIDLIVATLAIDAAAETEYRPFRRLRTQTELDAGAEPYPIVQYNVPTELHTQATIAVKTGVPNADPVAPVANAGEVPLWQVHVAAGQINLGVDDLTDVRNLMKSLYQLAADVETLAGSFAGVELLAHKGQPDGYAALDGTGKVPSAQLPATVVNSVFVVASQLAMLALAAVPGDIAVRTDINHTFILQTADATVLGHWVDLLTSASVLSFNARTGAVTLLLADILDALGFTPVNKAGDSMGPLTVNQDTNGQYTLTLRGTNAAYGIDLDLATATTLADLKVGGVSVLKINAAGGAVAFQLTKQINGEYAGKIINAGGAGYGWYLETGASHAEPMWTLKSALGIMLNYFADGRVSLGHDNPALISGNGKVSMAGDCFRLLQSRSPASNAAGNAGEFCWDANYLYVCTSANHWKRTPLYDY